MPVADFARYTYDGNHVNGRPQAKSFPELGEPVVFRGSTTGPGFNATEEHDASCSPLQVTWSVRPQCGIINIDSLDAWCKGNNVFNENHAHGIRHLVTKPELLSPIN